LPDKIVRTRIPGGPVIHIETTQLGDAEVEVVDLDALFDFGEVEAAIESLAGAIGRTIEKVKPKKACVEFGVEIGLESGALTAVLVKGTGKANLKITLEWS
jgi:hypothetical protein